MGQLAAWIPPCMALPGTGGAADVAPRDAELERFLLEAGVFPSFGMEISDLEAVKKMVEVGLGVAVLAGWAVRTEVAAGKLVAKPLGSGGLYRSWGLVHRANETPTAAQRALMGICKSSFPKLVSTPID